MPKLDYETLVAGVSQEQAMERVRAAKVSLGSRLTILGHHYQADAIVSVSDITGDSLERTRIGVLKFRNDIHIFAALQIDHLPLLAITERLRHLTSELDQGCIVI